MAAMSQSQSIDRWTTKAATAGLARRQEASDRDRAGTRRAWRKAATTRPQTAIRNSTKPTTPSSLSTFSHWL